MDEKPLYLQVEDRLKANIESGAWGPGEQVPGEQILCKQFGVSRVTLRHALANLVNEGLMVKEHSLQITRVRLLLLTDMHVLLSAFPIFADCRERSRLHGLCPPLSKRIVQRKWFHFWA